MKRIAKVAVGLTAVTLAASAFAGGPEMAPPTINGFNIGLGFGFNSYNHDLAQAEFGQLVNGFFPSGLLHPATHFGPIGEIGYTFQVNNWAFVGLRGFWQYDHFNTMIPVIDYVGQVDLRSHLAAMFLAGILLSSSNAVYLEAGYTAMWGKTTGQPFINPGQALPVSAKYTLNGGIAGIGWRHYFVNNVYLDLSYNFALYADSSTGVTIVSNDPFNNFAASGLKKTQVNGVTATLNYLFQV